MEHEIRKLTYYIFAAWITGFVFSTINRSFFIWYINIPSWLNRMLFWLRKNKPVGLIAVMWQITFIALTIILLLLFKFSIIADLDSVIRIFGYVFTVLFFIIGVLILFGKNDEVF